MLSRRFVVTSISALAIVAAAGSAFAQDKVKAVASFSILGDLVKEVGGDRIELTTLVGPDGDAHVYAPSPVAAKAMAEAKVVFMNGLGFEGWMERLVQSSGSKAELVTVSKGVETIAFGEEEGGHDHGHDHGKKEAEHDHGAIDPHAWQSVGNAKIYVANIRDALIAASPENKAVFEANAVTYLAKLDALDAEVRTAVAAIPEGRRTIITSHDAFGDFAHAYGIEVVAPQGVSTEAEPTAKGVAALIRQIKAEGVKAVFVENITDPRMIERIAKEGGARIGGALYSDALSPPGGPAGTYIDLIRHNIRTLSAGLSS
jgi:zinc/manganese transport system substrate-binding protein